MSDTIISMLVTIAGGLVTLIFEYGLRRFRGQDLSSKKSPTPAERLQTLIDNLSKSSKDAELLTQEIVADLRKRELALAELQSKNQQLAAEEEDLKKRIALLKEVPVDVAEYFQRINQQNLEKIDRRSSKRDIAFFILGAVVSAIVQLVL